MGLLVGSVLWHLILARLAALDWDWVVQDVRQFLIDQEELVEFKAKTVKRLLTEPL